MQLPQPHHTIGVITPSAGGFYFGRLLEGIYHFARQTNMRLIVYQGSPADIVASRLGCDHVSGWIAIQHTEQVEQFATFGKPILAVSDAVPGVPSLLADNQQGMRTAVEHLIGLGHTQIAFVGRLGNAEISERCMGYRAGLEAHGIPFDAQLVIDVCDEIEEGGQEAAQVLIQRGMPCTAIVAATDRNALALMTILQQRGYRCPEDVAIVGFDDISEAQATIPSLTTVRQDFFWLGIEAARYLVQIIEGPPPHPQPCYYPVQLVVRQSSGAAAGCAPAMSCSAPVGDWKEEARQRLVRALIGASCLDNDFGFFWPHLTALIDLIDAAINGVDAPPPEAIQQAWWEATQMVADAQAYKRVLDELAQAAQRQPADGGQSRARVQQALQQARDELVRVCIGREAIKSNRIDRTAYATSMIGHVLEQSAPEQIYQLDWLQHTEVDWGMFGRWDCCAADQPIHISGIYTNERQAAATPAGQPCSAAAFPPLALVQSANHDDDVILLAPIRTPRRQWGIIALAERSIWWASSLMEAYAQRIDSRESLRIWANQLGARLDNAALLGELQQQREVLQESYNRERALAETVRELGCPIIPLLPGVLLVPLIGLIDTRRVQHISTTVLEAVGSERAHHVLVDVTGVPLIDSFVAQMLIQLGQMTNLLGAGVTLVGVRPETAQSIVSLGVDLRRLQTESSLAAALQKLQRHAR